ncbi:hypothetical protein CRUP_037458 [Coryphaenoides rupestris]|nr:hypothetical protein CRUP_037458 [Coryphaenoides rupestris]
MNLCAQYLRRLQAGSRGGVDVQASPPGCVPEDAADSKLGAAEVWTSRQALQDVYQKMLVTDLEYALDKKVEQDLWNHAFKNQITTLQSQAKNRANPNRSEVQANLALFLEAASGFYTQLLQELCTVFHVDLPCRVRSSQLGILSNKQGVSARYRNQTSQAESYYRHAAQLVPSNGQPYNQLAILASSKGDHLTTIFYYCRSIAVKFPFPAASTNLQKALRDEVKSKWSVSDFIKAFIKFHGHVYLNKSLDKLSPLREKLEEQFQRLVLQKAFSSQQLVHLTVINLFDLNHLRDLSLEGTDQTYSPDQITSWAQLLGLFVSFLGVMCCRVLLNHHHHHQGELMGECPLPAVKEFELQGFLALRPALSLMRYQAGEEGQLLFLSDVPGLPENIKPREQSREAPPRAGHAHGERPRDPPLKGPGPAGRGEPKREGKRKCEVKRTPHDKACDAGKQAYVMPPAVPFAGLQVPGGKQSHIPYSQQRPSAPGPPAPGGLQQYMQVQDQPPAAMWTQGPAGVQKQLQKQAYFLSPQQQPQGPPPAVLDSSSSSKGMKFPDVVKMTDYYWEQAAYRMGGGGGGERGLAKRPPPGAFCPEADVTAPTAGPRGASFEQDNRGSALLPELVKSLADLEDTGAGLLCTKAPGFYQALAGPLSSAPRHSLFLPSQTRMEGISDMSGQSSSCLLPLSGFPIQEPSLYSLFEGTPWSPSLPASSDQSTPASQSPHSSNPSSLPSSPPTHSHGAAPFSNFGPIGTPDQPRPSALGGGGGGVGGLGLDYLPSASVAPEPSWHQPGSASGSWASGQDSPMEDSSTTVLLDSLKSIWSSSMMQPGPSALEQLLLQQKQQRAHGNMNPPH